MDITMQFLLNQSERSVKDLQLASGLSRYRPLSLSREHQESLS